MYIISRYLVISSFAFLAACGGGDDSGPAGPFSIGGYVNGLVGSGLVLQNNGRTNDNLTINSDGAFTFSIEENTGSTYNVTVVSQPTSPDQVCSIISGNGLIDTADINTVQVNCVTAPTYTIGGTVTGMTGTGLVLQNNAGNDLPVYANGSFTFTTPLEDLSSYSVSVLTQPGNPAQTCSVTSASGNVASANVSDIAINCAVNTYTVSVTVTGLNGSGLEVQNNNTDNIVINADGTYTFATSLVDQSGYNVGIFSQPNSSPSQSCSMEPAFGIISGANINIAINCQNNTFSVGGQVIGLSGSGLVLQNNGADDLQVNSDGFFMFSMLLNDLSAYNVTVLTQPSNPNQTCTVSSASGNIPNASVNSISINCSANTYTVNADVSGLSGSGLVLQINGTNNLSVSSDGTYTLATMNDLTAYDVTVLTQPGTPSQQCSVTAGSGNVASADVTASINCITNTFTVSATVSGMAGTGLVLQNNAGDDLTINSNGSLAFNSALDDLSAYNVTVLTQPVSSPAQVCSVSAGSGNIASANVNTVTVNCVEKTYSIGVTASGLTGTVVLQNNAGDDLSVSTTTLQNFSTGLFEGDTYNVTVSTQPATQFCSVSNASGTVAASDVTNVSISCEDTYAVGGTVSGLTGTLVLRNNGGDDETITSNTAYSFATRLLTTDSYSVAILSDPADQNCIVSNASGTVATSDITNADVSCVTVPAISSVSPIDTASIDNADSITITFSESMNIGTVALSGDLGSLAAAGVWSADGGKTNDTLTLSPTSNWGEGAGLTLTVDGNAAAGEALPQTTVSFNVLNSVVYVRNTDGLDTNPGTSDAPMATIGAAITQASGIYTTASVYVADGTYDVAASINMVEGISLYGGYDVANWATRNAAAGNTVITDTRTVGGTSTVPLSVVSASGLSNLVETVIDGFTINGTTNSTATAGIYLVDSRLTINGNTINAGVSTNGSYGIYSSYITDFTTFTKTITNNTVLAGSGAGTVGILDSISAQATVSGDYSSNIIQGGTGTIQALGIYVDTGSNANAIYTTVISNNNITGQGSVNTGNAIGVYISRSESTAQHNTKPVISHNQISGGEVTAFGSSVGISVTSSLAVIFNNRISAGGPTAFVAYGLTLSGQAISSFYGEIEVTNNTIRASGTDTSDGILLQTSNPVIEQNIIIAQTGSALTSCIKETVAGADPYSARFNDLYCTVPYFDFEGGCTGNADGDGLAFTCTIAELQTLIDLGSTPNSNVNLDPVLQSDDTFTSGSSPCLVSTGGSEFLGGSYSYVDDYLGTARTTEWSMGAIELDGGCI